MKIIQIQLAKVTRLDNGVDALCLVALTENGKIFQRLSYENKWTEIKLPKKLQQEEPKPCEMKPS